MITVDATNGRVSLRDRSGAVWLGPCIASVALDDGRVFSLTDAAMPESGVDGLVVRQRFAQGPELRWHFQPMPTEGALGIWLAVHNPTGNVLAIAQLEVFSAAGRSQQAGGPAWFARTDRAQLGFVSAGAQQCVIDTELRATQSVAIALPPGGTLPSELLWLVLDQSREATERSFNEAIRREGGIL